MNRKSLVALFGIILLTSLVTPAIPAFAAIASIQATTTIVDGATFTELDGPTAVHVVTIGSTPYLLVTSNDSLTIIDVSDPTSPSLVGTSGFIKDGLNGFTVMDGPVDVTTAVIGGSTYALVISDDEATADGLQIIDISTPSSPSAVATATDGATFTVLENPVGIDTFTISGTTYAIITSRSDNAVQIIDLSDPSNPAVAGTSGFITDGSNGFTALESPQGVTTVTISGTTYALVTSSEESAVQIIDVSNPASPSVVGTSGFITDGSNGFSEIEGPTGGQTITTFTIGSATKAVVAGSDDNGIEIIDISTPASPSSVSIMQDVTGQFQELESVRAVEVITVSGKLYLIAASNDDNGFEIINISDPTRPLKTFSRNDGVDSFDELSGANGIASVTVSGTTYLFISGGNDAGVQVVTLKTPVSTTTTGNFVQLFDDRDGFGGDFSFQMLGINSTNHIFVADEGDHTVRKFNSTGIHLNNTLGISGQARTDNNGFNFPHSVFHDSNDRIIVVDTSNDRVQIFTSTGTYAATLDGDETGATAFDFPHDGDVDSSNNIYIVDRDAGTGIVQKYSSAGAHLLTLTGGEAGATDFNQPMSVAIDSNDRIIVLQRAGFEGFQIFDSSGNFVKKVTTAATSGDTVFDQPHDIAVDSSDRIYVADQNNNRIQIFDSSGTFVQSITTTIGSTALSSPSSVAINSNGRIVVAEQGNNRVIVYQGFGVKIADTEGSSQTVAVDEGGGTATVEYSESEGAETETVSLAVTLPSATSGSVTVETVDEDTVEQGVQLATATDITAPCTDTCTVQFTVPNDVLTAAGLSSSSASIYHDSDGDEILQADEAITTTRDTTTIAGSTIFSGDASFTSKFAVGGVVGTTAQATAGAAAAFGLFGLINTCDENGFGQGQSLMVYDIMYDKCTEGQVKVYADTTCGPMTVKIGDAYGTSIAGMSSNQPLLNNDTKKVIFNHPIESDLEWFSVIITDKKDEFTDKIHTNQCTGTMSFTGNTGYTSEQQGVNSPSEDTITESTIPESKLILPGNVVEIIEATPDSIDEVFNTIANSESEIDPEPIIPDVDSFSLELMIDPEPQEPEIDPEPIDVSLWLQSFAEFWQFFIR